VARLRASASVKEIATEVADGLIDIRESARVLFTDCLPRLQSASPGSEEFEDALNDIGEEYRHIYYHIVHTQMFAYVIVPQE
jgi:hypothetical protein